MTPREIIAKHLCTMAAHDWDKITPFQRAAFRTTANGFLAALTAAGFRIVGPGEVDPVTVEKCALAAQAAIESEAYDLSDIRDGYIEARKTGWHSGRRISDDLAKSFAGKFAERSDAVYLVAEIATTRIRALKEKQG